LHSLFLSPSFAYLFTCTHACTETTTAATTSTTIHHHHQQQQQHQQLAARLYRHFKLALRRQGQAVNSGTTGGLVPTHFTAVKDVMAAAMASAEEVSLSETV